jgi:ribosomal protein L28
MNATPDSEGRKHFMQYGYLKNCCLDLVISGNSESEAENQFKRRYQPRAVLARVIVPVDNCNVSEVLFASQIYNVKIELKHDREQKVDAYNVQPKLQQT